MPRKGAFFLNFLWKSGDQAAAWSPVHSGSLVPTVLSDSRGYFLAVFGCSALGPSSRSSKSSIWPIVAARASSCRCFVLVSLLSAAVRAIVSVLIDIFRLPFFRVVIVFCGCVLVCRLCGRCRLGRIPSLVCMRASFRR